NAPFEDFSLSQYEAQMRVNAGAAFALTQAVAPGMRERRRGAIINLCSVTLNGRWSGYVPYVASKGAMLGLTRALARELGGHGIRVNGVSPGAVVSEAETRVFGDKAAEYASWVIENQSIKERIVAADIADAVLYLASDRARMVNGHILDVTAGW
ncbi:MAG: SDR family oxidoreductase, partial [Alphaproteobacteria bacterium]